MLLRANLVSGVISAHDPHGEPPGSRLMAEQLLDLWASFPHTTRSRRRSDQDTKIPESMANRARNPVARHEADSRVPRYLQVASVLRRRIRDGRWSVGDKIATLEELEREFDVARVTVRQAIDLLQGEGLVKSFQGRGTFVTKAVQNDRWMQLATDWESLIAPIRDHVPKLPSEARTAPRLEEDDGMPLRPT